MRNMFFLVQNSQVYKGNSQLICTTVDDFYFIDRNKNLVVNGIEVSKISFEPNRLCVKDEVILVFDSSNKGFLFDINTGETDDLGLADDEKILHSQIFDSNELFIRKELSLLDVSFGCYFKDSGTKRFYSNFFPKFFSGSYIFGNDKTSIFRYSEFRKTWSYDISKLGNYKNKWQKMTPYEVKCFIGVWKGQLVIQLTGGRFIGLCVDTGNLLWDVNKVKHNNTNQDDVDFEFGDPYNPHLDREIGHIYILQGEMLIDFNLNVLEATYIWNIKDERFESYPYIRQSQMFAGQIYFTGRSHINNDDDMVGIFDLEENKIVWQHIFDFDKGTFITNSPNNIQVNNKNLLVLDNKGELYVFEMEHGD